MGRHSKYNPAVLQTIRRLYSQGKTDDQVAKILGVSRQTIVNWQHRHAEFLYALKESKEMADDLVEASLYQRAVGYSVPEEKVFCFFGEIVTHQSVKHYPPDVVAGIFWLKNRRPEKWREKVTIEDINAARAIPLEAKLNFEEFCKRGAYPNPFEKQLGMYDFAFNETVPRMLLGSRGYGKTDYVTILGTAYDVYLNGAATSNLIITKSKSRNTAIMGEIAKVLELNGIDLERQNASCVRVKGMNGKDDSIEAVTIKTSLRGRHPKRVIMDDPVTEEDVSEAMRVLVKRKYNEVMKLCSDVVVIGQPAHKFDLYAELRPMVKLLEIPYGQIPELDHDLEAQRLAGVDEASIQASYFLNVVSEETSPFDKVHYVDAFPVGDCVAFIDPSFEGGDYTALSIVRGYMAGVVVVGFVYKKAWNHCLEDAVREMNRFGVRKLCFETNNLGTMPIEILNKSVGATIGVTGRKSNGNKHARIMAAGTYAHLIHISKESHRGYLDQVVKYEYNAKHDDAPDSLASCLEWIGLIRGKQ